MNYFLDMLVEACRVSILILLIIITLGAPSIELVYYDHTYKYKGWVDRILKKGE